MGATDVAGAALSVGAGVGLVIGVVAAVGLADGGWLAVMGATDAGAGLALCAPRLAAGDGLVLVCGAGDVVVLALVTAGDALGLGDVLCPGFDVSVGAGVGDPFGIGEPTAVLLGVVHGWALAVAGGAGTVGSASTAAAPNDWYATIAKMRRAAIRRPPLVRRVR